MRWECAREAPALGTTFHSLALEGAGEFFIYGALIVICYTIWAVWVKLVALSPQTDCLGAVPQHYNINH